MSATNPSMARQFPSGHQKRKQPKRYGPRAIKGVELWLERAQVALLGVTLRWRKEKIGIQRRLMRNLFRAAPDRLAQAAEA